MTSVNMRKKLRSLLLLMLTLSMLLPVMAGAAASPSMEIQFEKSNYSADELVVAKIYVKDAVFNMAGFSITYNTGMMKAVTSSGADSTVPGQLIKVENQFDDNTGEGLFTAQGRKADVAKGTMSAVLYLDVDAASKEINADSDGVLIASITFKMLANGKPTVNLAYLEGDPDFRDKTFLILNAGKQDLNASAGVVYLGSDSSADKVAAEAVEALINAIGTVTLESKPKIDAARSAYDNLTGAQKLLVENYSKLTDAEAEYKRLFEAQEFIIGASCGANGSINPTGQQVIKYGENLTFTITPNEGYEISSVQIDSVSIGAVASYTFNNVTGNHTIHAVFKLKSEPAKDPEKDTVKDPAKDPEKEPEKWVNPFIDVNESDWFYSAVEYVHKNGLVNGTGNNRFEPGTPMSRAMLVTLLYRYEGSPAVTAGNPFTDVVNGEWYANAIIWAAEKDIVEGYGNGLFGTNDNITREQIAALFMRYAQWKGYDTSKRNDLGNYTDANKISSWALEAMKWANAEELITGRTTTTLVPEGATTRAEASALLMRFIEKFVNQPVLK